MLNVVKEQKGSTLVVRMSGSIDENANFDQLIGPLPADVEVNSKDIRRINSIGVKGWIKFFQAAQAKGTKLHWVECSSAIVEQMNMIMNFSCGGTVESVYVPFSCTGCKSELVGLFKTADLKKLHENMPSLKCTKCGGTAEFDDIPEEYFAFLLR